MAFLPLKFTKDWTNPSDFPTYESDEGKVRADMQALHDETRAYINETLLPALEAETAAASLGVRMPSSSGSEGPGTIQEAIDSLSAVAMNGGAVPSGGLPGQILAKADAEDHHLKWISADAEAFGSYRKEKILSAATKTLFGLGADAVPDDAFWRIGQYNAHWWRRIKRTYAMQLGDGQQLILSLASANATEKTISYASEIAFDETTGKITMVNPTDIQVYYSGFSLSEFDVLNGKYVTSDYVSGIYYIDSDAVRDKWNTSKGYYCAIENPGAHLVRVSYTEDVRYFVSTDRSAYPDTGTSDGYEYEYLGVPFENATAAPKIAMGSYIGTGTAGESDPNSLTFESDPLLVIIFTEAPTVFVRNNNEAATHISADYGGYASVEWDGKTVHWHAKPGYWSGTSSSTTESATAEKQLNAPAQVYPYIALLR